MTNKTAKYYLDFASELNKEMNSRIKTNNERFIKEMDILKQHELFESTITSSQLKKSLQIINHIASKLEINQIEISDNEIITIDQLNAFRESNKDNSISIEDLDTCFGYEFVNLFVKKTIFILRLSYELKKLNHIFIDNSLDKEKVFLTLKYNFYLGAREFYNNNSHFIEGSKNLTNEKLKEIENSLNIKGLTKFEIIEIIAKHDHFKHLVSDIKSSTFVFENGHLIKKNDEGYLTYAQLYSSLIALKMVRADRMEQITIEENIIQKKKNELLASMKKGMYARIGKNVFDKSDKDVLEATNAISNEIKNIQERKDKLTITDNYIKQLLSGCNVITELLSKDNELLENERIQRVQEKLNKERKRFNQLEKYNNKDEIGRFSFIKNEIKNEFESYFNQYEESISTLKQVLSLNAYSFKNVYKIKDYKNYNLNFEDLIKNVFCEYDDYSLYSQSKSRSFMDHIIIFLNDDLNKSYKNYTDVINRFTKTNGNQENVFINIKNLAELFEKKNRDGLNEEELKKIQLYLKKAFTEDIDTIENWNTEEINEKNNVRKLKRA